MVMEIYNCSALAESIASLYSLPIPLDEIAEDEGIMIIMGRILLME